MTNSIFCHREKHSKVVGGDPRERHEQLALTKDPFYDWFQNPHTFSVHKNPSPMRKQMLRKKRMDDYFKLCKQRDESLRG